MKGKNNKSPNRTRYRDVRDKFNDASKALSHHIYHTRGDVPLDKLIGYKASGGYIIDQNGNKCQLQLSVIRNKSNFIKDGEVKNVFSRWSFMFRLRLYIVALLNKYGS